MNGNIIAIIGTAFAATFCVGLSVISIVNQKKEDESEREFLRQMEENNKEIENISKDIDRMREVIHEQEGKTRELIERMKATIDEV